MESTLPSNECNLTFDSTPGGLYHVRLTVLDKDGKLAGCGERMCKSVFSLNELERLMVLAMSLLGEGMQPFMHLYRCKPKCYWDQIYSMDKIMHKYIKDNNGQAASPINGEIYGEGFELSKPMSG
jgi:hypothetical protein